MLKVKALLSRMNPGDVGAIVKSPPTAPVVTKRQIGQTAVGTGLGVAVGIASVRDPRFGVAAHILGDFCNHCEVLGFDLELVKIKQDVFPFLTHLDFLPIRWRLV